MQYFCHLELLGSQDSLLIPSSLILVIHRFPFKFQLKSNRGFDFLLRLRQMFLFSLPFSVFILYFTPARPFRARRQILKPIIPLEVISSRALTMCKYCVYIYNYYIIYISATETRASGTTARRPGVVK